MNRDFTPVHGSSIRLFGIAFGCKSFENSLNQSHVPFACGRNLVPACRLFSFREFGRLDGLWRGEGCVNDKLR